MELPIFILCVLLLGKYGSPDKQVGLNECVALPNNIFSVDLNHSGKYLAQGCLGSLLLAVALFAGWSDSGFETTS